MKDNEVVKKIKNGEIDYFIFIVRKYQSKLFQFFFQRLIIKDDVNDLIQETFIKFYKNINNFKEEKSILPYLLAIAQNELKIYWRKNSQKVLSLDETIEVNSQSFEEDVDLNIFSMNERQRKIIHLLKQGYRYREIGKILKLNENTIKTIIRRFRLKINKNQNENK